MNVTVIYCMYSIIVFNGNLPSTDYHSSMLNITSRIAVRIKNLPDWPFEWSDTTPQRSIESLTPSDFLPSEDDAKELKTRAVRYMVRFLVKEFSSLADLRGFIPEETHHPKHPSEVVPMKVLFKDEKYTAETIDILAQLAVDADLTDGAPQVSAQTYTQTCVHES